MYLLDMFIHPSYQVLIEAEKAASQASLQRLVERTVLHLTTMPLSRMQAVFNTIKGSVSSHTLVGTLDI